jgi:hypothetical protein
MRGPAKQIAHMELYLNIVLGKHHVCMKAQP